MILSASMSGYYPNFVVCDRVVSSPLDIPKDAKLLILWGGEDIGTALYGQLAGKSHGPRHPSVRDKNEACLVHAAVKRGIPILGICRGAQLLCALGGGTLWQDVGGHTACSHAMVYKGKRFVTNSDHHQMMRPTKDMVVLAATPDALSKCKYAESAVTPMLDTNPEPEIVLFPKMKALGVQGHPEWLDPSHDLVQLTKELCEEYLDVQL